jgi:hypothetical protein
MPFPCRSHDVSLPFPCRFPAVPLPDHEYAFLKASSQDHGSVVAWTRQGDGMGTAWERHGMCELASAVQRRHGDLPAFGLSLLPRGVPGSLLSEASQSQMQVGSVKQSKVCGGREKAYYWCKDMIVCMIYNKKIMIAI